MRDFKYFNPCVRPKFVNHVDEGARSRSRRSGIAILDSDPVEGEHLSTSLRVATVRAPRADDPIPYDLVLLSWRERSCPQGSFECVHGDVLILDLATGTTLSHGDRLFLPDARNVEVIAAEEHLAEVRGSHLPDWVDFLSGRGVPCQWETDRLLILRDARVEHELRRLGAIIRYVSEPFEPEISN